MTIQFNLASGPANQPANNYTFNLANYPINLEGQWEVALYQYSLWFTTSNISAALGNNKISYSSNGGSSWTVITIPDGNYEISDINNIIQNGSGGVTGTGDNVILSVIQAQYTSMFTISGNYQINLLGGTGGAGTGTSKLYNIIGFTSTQAQSILTASTVSNNTGATQANILNGFTNFTIALPNLINPNSSFGASSASGASSSLTGTSVAYSDSWKVPPGYLQVVSVYNLIWLPINVKTISNIQVVINDQSGNPIDFGQGGNYNNNSSSINIYLRQVHTPQPVYTVSPPTTFPDVHKKMI